MKYIKVINKKGEEVEERKMLRADDKEYNYVLEQAVKITRENHNRDNPDDLQTYEIVTEET
jgi:hypothetical protein